MMRTARFVVCLLVLGTSAGARAGVRRYATPLGGRPWIANDVVCFTATPVFNFDGSNRLTNAYCSTTRKWLFSLPIDNTGRYISWFFTGAGNGTDPVTCAIVSNSNDGLAGWVQKQTRTSPTYALMSGGFSQWVPIGGTLHGDCDIPFGGGVSAAQYDP